MKPQELPEPLLGCNAYTLNIERIKRVFDLLTQANAEEYATINDMARELRARKTDLMDYINKNPKLFTLSQRWKPKTKVVTRTRPFHQVKERYKEEITVRGANLGLCLESVYLKPEDNYRTSILP